ncbi:MAG: hypothetical protein J4400_01850 [Candidatus Aenigmarchaeota archaeon]|nr:hypothetical protein [Candidatus Aenigmarchaeota archaeon]
MRKALLAGVLACSMGCASSRHVIYEPGIGRKINTAWVLNDERAGYVRRFAQTVYVTRHYWDNYEAQMRKVKTISLYDDWIHGWYGGVVYGSKRLEHMGIHDLRPHVLVHELCHVWHSALPPAKRKEFERKWSEAAGFRYGEYEENSREIVENGLVALESSENMMQDVSTVCELVIILQMPNIQVPGVSRPGRSGSEEYNVLFRRDDEKVREKIGLLGNYKFISSEERDFALKELDWK